MPVVASSQAGPGFDGGGFQISDNLSREGVLWVLPAREQTNEFAFFEALRNRIHENSDLFVSSVDGAVLLEEEVHFDQQRFNADSCGM